MGYWDIEAHLDPPEKEPDGALCCDCCGEIIPGGESMCVLKGFVFCEYCIQESAQTAPYREEVYPE